MDDETSSKGLPPQLFCCLGLLMFIPFFIGLLSCTFTDGCDASALETDPGTLVGTDLPDSLKPIFNAAAEKYQVSPAFLAAIFWVEHGKNYPESGPWASSPVGANGPFQFMEGTWEGWSSPYSDNGSFETNPATINSYNGYGQDGNSDSIADVQNLWDAAFAAADLLGANGAANATDLDALRDAASRYNSGRPWSQGQNIPETARYVPLVIEEYQRLQGTM